MLLNIIFLTSFVWKIFPAFQPILSDFDMVMHVDMMPV